MEDYQKQLEFILQNDWLNVLQEKPKKSDNISEDERLIKSFGEVTDFFDEHGRKPDKDSDIIEYSLACRLKGIHNMLEKAEKLADHDRYNLLKEELKTAEDVFTKDPLGLLSNKDNADIFTLKHVSPQKPDFITDRRTCKNFKEYEPLFKSCHADLADGQRKTMRFKREQNIRAGEFFILRGVLLYVASVGDKKKTGDRVNARLRCIFENGTESDMLLRSLATGLYRDKNGRRVYSTAISREDVASGFIYVLKSKSQNPEITAISDLYKIGYSTTSVEKRIKNAAKEPTYLMAEVSIVESFKCYNINIQKLEFLLHTFFAGVCLDIEITDAQGKPYVPREWFVVPLPVIKEAIELFLDATITNYYYDPSDQRIVPIAKVISGH